MMTRRLTVTSDLGPRARAAALMAITMKPYSSKVEVRLDRKVADARSIFDLLLLGDCAGKVIQVAASGADEEQAIEAVASLLNDRYGGVGRAKRH